MSERWWSVFRVLMPHLCFNVYLGDLLKLSTHEGMIPTTNRTQVVVVSKPNCAQLVFFLVRKANKLVNSRDEGDN